MKQTCENIMNPAERPRPFKHGKWITNELVTDLIVACLLPCYSFHGSLQMVLADRKMLNELFNTTDTKRFIALFNTM
jgi:hypothetical protein